MTEGKIPAIELYCRLVRKGLKCDRKTRKKLVDKLKSELYERGFSDQAGFRDITQIIGEPEEAARILLDTVTVDNVLHNSRKKLISFIWIVVASFLLVVGIGLLIFSRDRGNLIFDRSLPTKEKAYRDSGAQWIEKGDKSFRNRLKNAWGAPDFSRSEYDCWRYRDTYIVVDYKNTLQEAGFALYYALPSAEFEIKEVLKGYYRCEPSWSEGNSYFDFSMSEVILLQTGTLVPGDKITMEYDPYFLEYKDDKEGNEIITCQRLFTVQKKELPSEGDKSTLRDTVSTWFREEAMSTGIVLLLFSIYFLISYLIYRIMKKMAYPKPWFAWIPFFNLTVVYEAVQPEEKRKESIHDQKGNNIGNDSVEQEFDQDGLIGYISIMTNVDRR